MWIILEKQGTPHSYLRDEDGTWTEYVPHKIEAKWQNVITLSRHLQSRFEDGTHGDSKLFFLSIYDKNLI